MIPFSEDVSAIAQLHPRYMSMKFYHLRISKTLRKDALSLVAGMNSWEKAGFRVSGSLNATHLGRIKLDANVW